MKYLIGIFLVFIVYVLTAQPADVRAKAAYLKAQELYGSGDYPGAIVKLDQVKELLGSTNPRVEYLLAQCHFQTKNIAKADEAIAAYFKLAADDDPNYMTMLQMIEEVESVRDEYNLAQAKIKQEQAAWQEAKTKNTREAYAEYAKRYPQGLYIPEARKKIVGIIGDLFIDPRDSKTYQTVWIGNQLWMAENMQFQSEGAYYNKKTDATIYSARAHLIDKTICPAGWHLPTTDETLTMLGYLGLNKEIHWTPYSDANETGATLVFNQVKEIVATLIDPATGVSNVNNASNLNFTSGELGLADGVFRFSWVIEDGSNISFYRSTQIFRPNTMPYKTPTRPCRCVKD